MAAFTTCRLRLPQRFWVKDLTMDGQDGGFLPEFREIGNCILHTVNLGIGCALLGQVRAILPLAIYAHWHILGQRISGEERTR